MATIPPAPTLDVDSVLSCALAASTWAARGNGEQLKLAHGSVVDVGCCMFGWKKSYAEGDKVTGLSLLIPWGALSWAVTMDRRTARGNKMRTKVDKGFMFLFHCLFFYILLRMEWLKLVVGSENLRMLWPGLAFIEEVWSVDSSCCLE